MKHRRIQKSRKFLQLGATMFVGGAMTLALTTTPAWSAAVAPGYQHRFLHVKWQR
jgi:hypothetical protein